MSPCPSAEGFYSLKHTKCHKNAIHSFGVVHALFFKPYYNPIILL